MKDDDDSCQTDFSLENADNKIKGEEPEIYKVQSLERRSFLKGLGAASGTAAAATLSGCGGSGGDSTPDNTSQIRSTCDLETIFTHNFAITSVAYSPNSQYAATAGGAEIIIWDAISGNLLFRLNHGITCNALAFSPDSAKLASNGGNIIVVWDVFSGAQIISIQTSGASYARIAFSSDGASLVSNSDAGDISIWNVTDGSLVRSYAQHHAAVTDMAISADRSKVVSMSGSDEMPRVWEFDSLSTLYSGTFGLAEPNAVFDLGPGLVSTINISGTQKVVDDSFNVNISTNYPGGRYVTVDLTSPIGTNVRLWEGTGNLGFSNFAGTFPVNIQPAETLAILNGESIDGTWTLSISSSVGFNSRLIRWSIRSTPSQPSDSVSFGRPGHILFGTTNGLIVIWDYENEQLIRQYDQHVQLQQQRISTIQVTPDGSKVVSADTGGTMKIWDYDTGNTIVANTSDAGLIDMNESSTKVVTGFEFNAYIRNAITGSTSLALLDEATTGTTLSVDCSQSGGSTSYCSCDTVCSCDSVCSCDTVCTCDSQCTCQSQCTCDSQSSHYWYPN